MVRLHVKKGDESQFLYDTHAEANVENVIRDVVVIYNGRLKISRICYGKCQLCEKGARIPRDYIKNCDYITTERNCTETFSKIQIISSFKRHTTSHIKRNYLLLLFFLTLKEIFIRDRDKKKFSKKNLLSDSRL